MSLLAVRSDPFRGVYAFETEAQRAELARRFNGASMRDFRDDEREHAEAWSKMQKTHVESFISKADDVNILSTILDAGYEAIHVTYRDGAGMPLAVDLLLTDVVSVDGGLPFLEMQANELRIAPVMFGRRKSMDFDEYQAFAKEHDLSMRELAERLGKFQRMRKEYVTLHTWKHSNIICSEKMLFAERAYAELTRTNMELTGAEKGAATILWNKIESIEPYLKDSKKVVGLLKRYCPWKGI